MSIGAFSLDQLMELAGLSVSQAGRLFTLEKGQCVLTQTNSLPYSSSGERQADSRRMRPRQ